MIIKGILETISDGIKHNGSISERAYLKMNNKRFKRIISDDVVDNICQENLGNEIEISITKSIFGKIIGAIKEPNGEITKTSAGIFIFFLLIKGIFTVPVVALTYLILGFINDIQYTEIPEFISFLWALWPIITFIKGLKSRCVLK